ncbi:MAG TPA: alpha-galactosidase [Verrucomicrobiae bacterium]|nr:alpha-galactosidase [Verrucomicrobiae bacterium]
MFEFFYQRFAWVLLISSFVVSFSRAAVPDLVKRIQADPNGQVVASAGVDATKVKLQRRWNGDLCQFSLDNTGAVPVKIHEVILADLEHGLPPTSPVYGEGFQMLSQTAGTLAEPKDVGGYTDRGHYRLPESPGLWTVYGLLMLSPAQSERLLLGFASCRRFNGKFQFNTNRLQVVIETEDLELGPGQSWQLEDLVVSSGPNRDLLLDHLATAIQRNHLRLPHDPEPTGWCSWYCFGPRVTAKNITDNLEWIAHNLPALRYIQIDDGYQPWMGDWLATGKAFGGGVQGVLRDVREHGFQPALWVAPFIASEQSQLFQENPDWFVKDGAGHPLRSDRVGFGGWRLGPWYALDGTHPEAQRWLESLFRTMRQDWGCTYFKLDATYWGTLPGGHRYDRNATRIEAYRRGMEAIRRGAGDALLMGCNHPIWPSLGLVHASRSSLDIGRKWSSFTGTGRENLLRGWQNGRLWWNDPDCVVLHDNDSKDIMDAGGKLTTSGKVPDNEYQFHATLIYATGGMLLSGDDLTRITPRRAEMLKKLVPPSGICARFEDENFTVGITPLGKGEKGEKRMFSLLNWSDTPAKRKINLPGRSRLLDYWTGEDLGVHAGQYEFTLAPRSGRLLLAQDLEDRAAP